MNLKIAICDDNKNDIEAIEKYVSKYNIQSNNNVVFSAYYSTKDLLLKHKKEHYDVILLDIEMPEMNGIDLAKKLRQLDDNLLIVFTTSYPEYMKDSFEVQPFQFLSKPITYENIQNLLTNIINKISRNMNTIIIVDDDNEKNFVYLKDILYVSVFNRKKGFIKYQLIDREFITKGTISNIESDFIAHGFVLTARGFLVNLNQIKSMNSNRVLLKNNVEIPISRRRMKEIQKIYTNHIIEIMT